MNDVVKGLSVLHQIIITACTALIIVCLQPDESEKLKKAWISLLNLETVKWDGWKYQIEKNIISQPASTYAADSQVRKWMDKSYPENRNQVAVDLLGLVKLLVCPDPSWIVSQYIDFIEHGHSCYVAFPKLESFPLPGPDLIATSSIVKVRYYQPTVGSSAWAFYGSFTNDSELTNLNVSIRCLHKTPRGRIVSADPFVLTNVPFATEEKAINLESIPTWLETNLVNPESVVTFPFRKGSQSTDDFYNICQALRTVRSIGIDLDDLTLGKAIRRIEVELLNKPNSITVSGLTFSRDLVNWFGPLILLAFSVYVNVNLNYIVSHADSLSIESLGNWVGLFSGLRAAVLTHLTLFLFPIVACVISQVRSWSSISSISFLGVFLVLCLVVVLINSFCLLVRIRKRSTKSGIGSESDDVGMAY